MDFVFIVLMITLLFIFGYAQLQKGVVRTTGQITLSDYNESPSLEENL